MSKMDKAWLYWNTIRSLRPVQIRYQIKNRILKNQKKKLAGRIEKLRAPEILETPHILIPELDCEKEYLRRFRVEELLENQIDLLHEMHVIEKNWKVSSASHLWNYNLHYLEFLIPLAAKYKITKDERYFLKWKELLESWMEQATGDSLEPYTISMRIPNLLICRELLSEKIKNTQLEQALITSIYQQYRYLLYAQEKALLANHYFENLKTLVISSLFFHELETYHKYFDLFLKEIEEQILSDGLHFERSLMYHKIILEDILRVYVVLKSSNHLCDGEKLVPTIKIMTAAMVNLEEGFPRTPLFNDSGNNVSKKKDSLLRAAQKICGYEKTAIRSFEASGYYKLHQGETTILFDCGDIGPSYMGGHAHCDCLSFELCVQGKALFVNSGTGQYQGELRPFFRSTAAHNTIMIDDREQSELWGEHRAARRIRTAKGELKAKTLVGSFQSYQGDLFRRSFTWKNERTLVIRDEWRAYHTGRHMARQFLHLGPDFCYRRNGSQIEVWEGKRQWAVIWLPAKSDYLIHTEGQLTNYAENFGEYGKKQVLEIRTPFQDKAWSQIEIEIRTGEQ
ncbi:MAG: hypothetical protein HFI33_10475 [Lachnospiraceae bacterium]|nr:hypothetical protein [Lachnospiraceae bacterium]